MVEPSSEQSSKCSHCGGAHPDYAHDSFGVAVQMVDAAIVEGDQTTARSWLRVVAKLGRRA
jgi:hypothetical protein